MTSLADEDVLLVSPQLVWFAETEGVVSLSLPDGSEEFDVGDGGLALLREFSSLRSVGSIVPPLTEEQREALAIYLENGLLERRSGADR